MKNIFKKLHRNHDHRLNDSTTNTNTTTTSNITTTTSSSSGSVSSVPSPSSIPSPSGDRQQNQQQQEHVLLQQQQLQQSDYFASEEEFQVQLALAISASNTQFREDRDKDQIRAATLLSLGPQRDEEDRAESLSRRYWDYNVLDYEDKVVDGFYDIYGSNAGPASQEKMPLLVDLQAKSGDPRFEVVVVNRAIDPVLEELHQVAQCLALDCSATQVRDLVERLAELVTKHMGGRVVDANIMFAKWLERTTELQTSLQTNILPIGSITSGLSRHRALLFKVLLDSVGISCRLVKGSHYTGNDDDAINIVKLEDEREFLVDLMAAPGTLIPADILNLKDTSFSMYEPGPSKPPGPQLIGDSNIGSSTLNLPHNTHNAVKQNSNFGNNVSFSKKPISGMAESAPSCSSENIPISILNNSNKNVIVPVSQSDLPFSVAGTSSQYKGEHGNTSLNMIDSPQETLEESKKLFADLNPFQIKSSGQNNYTDLEVKDFQRRRENLVSGPGRPPSPLVWKNRPTSNEISQKKQYEFREGIIQRNNQEIDCYKRSSLTSSSSATSEKITLEVYNSAAVSDGNDNPIRRHVPTQSPVSNHHEQHFNDVGIPQNVVKSHRKQQSKDFMDDVAKWEIPWEDLVIGERIGLGSYGEVYHADWNDKEVAVKKFLDQDFSGDALDEFRSEVRIMRRLRHPNVVLFLGAVTRPPNLSIITEFLPRGSLYRIVHRPNCQIDEKRRIKMALDVAMGMTCLHASIPMVVHRDLKSPNLLVDTDWNVKVCDFGLSRLKHNTFLSSKSTAGTPEWMAPEVLRNEQSNEKCDVYSFGVILWELTTLRMPWTGMNPMQVVGAVGFQNRRLDIPKEIDPLVARIIRGCWQTDPTLRPSFAELVALLQPLQHLTIPLLQQNSN